MIIEIRPGVAELAPGEELAVEVVLTNDGDQPIRPSVGFDGIEPQYVDVGSVPVELEVGTTASISCLLSLPATADPGDRRLVITVGDLNGWAPGASAVLELWVGDRPDISLQVVPPTITGRRAATMTTLVHNRSDEPLPLMLDGDGDALAFGFALEDVVVAPRGDLEVDTSVVSVRRSWFREVRHGGLVQVRGAGAPVSAPMTFVQRPWIPPLLTKMVAAITVLAVWAAAVVVVVDRIEPDPNPTKFLALGPDAAEAFARARGGADARDLVPTSLQGQRAGVQGAVMGPTDPAGTTVVLERVSLGDEGTTAGSGIKLAAFTPVQQAVGNVLDRIETVTDDQGSFRITDGLQVPGFYRVTALRPGYEVASQVANLTDDAPLAELALELLPASGGLSGTIRDQDGAPLGGAGIEVTDGSLVYTATSATEGTVGSWSIGGVAAPAVYEVTATARGYASASLRVPLEGGQQRSGVDAVLQGGLGTIRGQVSNRGDGVGGVTVELVGENNDVERTTTTVTDDGLAGRFDLPALPFGTYLLTFSGAGWQTQTTQVVVDTGNVEVAVSDLRSATAVVQGTVHQQVLPGGECAYPDPDRPGDRDRVRLEPCGGVGVSVIGADQTWRTTSASGTGTFQVSRIPPGEYLVRFERAGYVPRFYEVVVDAGEVVTLPEGAAAFTPDAVRVVEMLLTPQLDRRAGRIQGVIRNANTPADPFEPPSGTRIELVGEPDALVERLTDGAFRITSVQAGAQTIRIEAPGFDTFERLVRVPFGDTVDAGALAITPLGSLELRVTGGQATPVPDAQVFVAPDPAVYGTAGPLPRFEPDGAVTACTRTIELDGSDVTLSGVCASTDAVGDASFRRIFSTGSYVLATPVNDPATDAANDPATRATTVPLDHEVLVRRVDIDSGATVRLDLSLRRFAIITGVIRRPAGDGLERVDVGEGDIEFQLIDPDNNNQPVIPYPDDLPVPRISFDDNSDLEIGQYRIDRIPADSGDRQFVWRLVIRADGDEFILGPGSTRDPVQGLQYNEIRTITALLTPQPQTVRFVTTYDAVGFADPQPVPGAGFRLTGTSDFLPREDDPSAFDLQITTCPGPGCEISVGDGEFFDFQAASSPFVEARAGSGLWLRGDEEPPIGGFRIPPFFRPGEATFSIDADGFVRIDEEVVFEAPDVDGDDIVIERALVAQPRAVAGTVGLVPATADYPLFLEDFGVSGDAGIFTSLEATLAPADDPTAGVTVAVSGDGTFRFDGGAAVMPGRYLLDITSIDGVPPTFVEEFAPLELLIPPGTAAFAVPADQTTLWRTGIIRVSATDAAGAPLPGVDVTLTRVRFTFVPLGDPESVDALVTCTNADSDTGGPACAAGLATFVDLPLLSPDRIAWRYTIEVDRDGYLYRGDDLHAFPLSRAMTYTLLAPSLDRYGEVSGTVEGQIPSDGTPLDGIDGATVRLVDFATGADVLIDGAPVTATTDPDGAFVFPNTLEIPPRSGPLGTEEVCTPQTDPVTGDPLLDPVTFEPLEDCTDVDVIADGDRYGLVAAAMGYDSNATVPVGPFTLAFNTAIPDADILLDAQNGSLSGVVTEIGGGDLVDLDPDATPIEARVEVFRVDTDALVTSLTTTDGAYLIGDLEPREYLVRFTALTAEEGARPILEVPLEIGPGQAKVRDVEMPRPVGSLQGKVTLALLDPVSFPDGDVALDAEGLPDFSGVKVIAERQPGGGGGRFTYPPQFTDAAGNYLFSALEGGTYTVTFEKDGYTLGTRSGIIVLGSGAGSTTVDETLIAETIEVTVRVTSAIGAALEGVTVAPVYRGVATSSVPTVDPEASDDLGEVSFELPPVPWDLTTSGADLLTPIPHIDEPGQPLVLRPGVDPGVVPLELDPFASITGTTALRPVAGADSSPSDDVVIDAPDGATVIGPAADGSFTVFILAVPGQGEQVTLDFTSPGYTPEQELVGPGAFVDGTAAIGEVTLLAIPREVSVTFESSVSRGSVADLRADDIEARISFAGLAAPVVVTPNRVVRDNSGGTATAIFSADEALPPGTWTFSTQRAEDLRDRHQDAVSEQTVEVYVGAPPVPVVALTVTLTRLVSIQGTVTARYVTGGAPQAIPAGLEVEVYRSDDPEETPLGRTRLTTVTDVNTGVQTVNWSVLAALEDPEVVLVASATAPGYARSDVQIAAPATDLTGIGIDLIADPVDVPVTVISAVGDVPLNGVKVTATYDADPLLSVPGTTPGEGEEAGVVTLRLPPGAWTLTTTGAADATDAQGEFQPHGDEPGEELVFAPGQTPTPTLKLDPFVEISGTVEPVAFLDGPQLATFTGATVVVSDGTEDFTGTVEPLIDDPDDDDDGRAPWSASIPPNITATVTFSATDYDDTVVSGVTVATADVTVPNAQIAATPIDVTITVTSNDVPPVPLDEVEVVATYLEDAAADPRVKSAVQPGISGKTDTDGTVVLGLPPGSSAIETVGANGYHDATLVPTGSQVLAPTVVVPLGGPASPTSATILLNANSVLLGTTWQQRGDTLTPIGGVEVIAEREGERFSTVSGAVDDAGDNYRLRARAGIWRITAVHDGETILVDEAFEIRKDGPGVEPNRLQIVIPSNKIALAGQVVDDADQGVEGAQVQGVSSIGTVTTVTDAEGRYVLDGLDNTVTWAVTFTPPAGMDAQPVTRWIALNGELSADVSLDQRLPVGLGELELRLTGGQPGTEVEVTLRESTPFPTLNAEGILRRTTTLDADGTGGVLFEYLVPGDGRSIPQDRFSLDIQAPSADPVTRAGLDVGPGQTTVVEVDLDAVIDLTRDVELTLVDDVDRAPITGRTVTLENGTTTVRGTVEPDSNLYRFAGVDPGAWQVVVSDHEDGSITVPEGEGTFAATVLLTPVPTEDDTTSTEDDVTSGDSATDEGGATTDEGGTTADPDPPSEDDGTSLDDGTSTEGAADGDDGTDGTGDTGADAADDAGTDGEGPGSSADPEGTETERTDDAGTEGPAAGEGDPDGESA